MALTLLSIDRAAFMRIHKRVEHGELEAALAVAKLWADYPPAAELECFLCSKPCGNADYPLAPPFSIVLPEYDPRFTASKLIAAPLCLSCAAIKPPALRFARCLSLLKKMAKARGKPVAFHQIKHHQPHPT